MKHKQKLRTSATTVRSNARRSKTHKTTTYRAGLRRGLRQDRCEMTRSVGSDPTGERAIECGAAAALMCEVCGPMCAECAETTFCFRGEHRLVSLDEPSGKSQPTKARSKRLREIVVLQMSCGHCGIVRLLWPCDAGGRPAMKRQCPGCKRRVEAIVLGYGWTRIPLPYFEQVDGLLDLCTSHKFERRIPWDFLKAKPKRDD